MWKIKATGLRLRKLLALLAVNCILIFAFYGVLLRSYLDISSNGALKSILIWNSDHRIETSVFGKGHEAFLNARCPISDCIIYTNRSALPPEQYDAIVIHMHELWLTVLPRFQRKPHQRFILLSQESPANLLDKSFTCNGVFNWTMTYKLNSDIKLLYGRFKEKASAPKSVYELDMLKAEMRNLANRRNYALGKAGLAVWMASHCKTHGLRETYVRKLKKHIRIDVYGECGQYSCPRDVKNWLSYPFCYDILDAKYKFYLSFENSICKDYVTEKFFNVMKYNMIPVVYGGANYSALAPPHSYINALDYTPKALANYLKLLNANDSLYNEYFWWKDHYELESGVHQMARHAFCDLCEKLHADKQVKIYKDLVPEWHHSTQCRKISIWW